MKTITAKELQTNQAAILRDVRAGQEYQVTFHRKPVARLTPMLPEVSDKPKPGSRAAFLESLKHTVHVTGDLRELSYDELRDRIMEEKYGK